MRFFKLYICIFAFFYSSCSPAASEKKNAILSCPSVFPVENSLPDHWLTVTKVPAGKFHLEAIDIAFGDAMDLKKRLASKERLFDTEITDDWLSFSDRVEFKAEYAQDHGDISMLCTYGKTRAEANDANLNIELIIPLPKNKPVNCLLIRRDVEPRYEMSCEASQ